MTINNASVCFFKFAVLALQILYNWSSKKWTLAKGRFSDLYFAYTLHTQMNATWRNYSRGKFSLAM